MSVVQVFELKLNIDKKTNSEKIIVTANDNVKILAELMQGKSPFPLLPEYIFRLVSKPKGKNTVIRDLVVEDGKVVISLNHSETGYQVPIECVVQVFDEEGNRISSAKFDVVVLQDFSTSNEVSPSGDATFRIVSEAEFNKISLISADVEGSKATFNTLTERLEHDKTELLSEINDVAEQLAENESKITEMKTGNLSIQGNGTTINNSAFSSLIGTQKIKLQANKVYLFDLSNIINVTNNLEVDGNGSTLKNLTMSIENTQNIIIKFKNIVFDNCSITIRRYKKVTFEDCHAMTSTPTSTRNLISDGGGGIVEILNCSSAGLGEGIKITPDGVAVTPDIINNGKFYFSMGGSYWDTTQKLIVRGFKGEGGNSFAGNGIYMQKVHQVYIEDAHFKNSRHTPIVFFTDMAIKPTGVIKNCSADDTFALVFGAFEVGDNSGISLKDLVITNAKGNAIEGNFKEIINCYVDTTGLKHGDPAYLDIVPEGIYGGTKIIKGCTLKNIKADGIFTGVDIPRLNKLQWKDNIIDGTGGYGINFMGKQDAIEDVFVNCIISKNTFMNTRLGWISIKGHNVDNLVDGLIVENNSYPLSTEELTPMNFPKLTVGVSFGRNELVNKGTHSFAGTTVGENLASLVAPWSRGNGRYNWDGTILSATATDIYSASLVHGNFLTEVGKIYEVLIDLERAPKGIQLYVIRNGTTRYGGNYLVNERKFISAYIGVGDGTEWKIGFRTPYSDIGATFAIRSFYIYKS